MKKMLATVAMVGAVLLTAGCANVTPQVAVSSKFWENRQGTVGVVQTKLPTPGAFQEGAQGLLDVAINQGMASEMNKQIQAANLDRANAISDNFVKRLSDRGFTVKKLDTALDDSKLPDFKKEGSATGVFAKKDYRGLKSEGVERLLVVNVKRVGTVRPYYGFIPLGGPSAVFDVSGQLIDLNTNELLWNHDASTRAAITDPWDQPPAFTNVLNGIRQEMEKGSTSFERNFFMDATTAKVSSAQ